MKFCFIIIIIIIIIIQITVTEVNWSPCAGGQRSLHRGAQVNADSQGTACPEGYSQYVSLLLSLCPHIRVFCQRAEFPPLRSSRVIFEKRETYIKQCLSTFCSAVFVCLLMGQWISIRSDIWECDVCLLCCIPVLKLSLTSQHTTEPLAGSCQLEECEKLWLWNIFYSLFLN